MQRLPKLANELYSFFGRGFSRLEWQPSLNKKQDAYFPGYTFKKEVEIEKSSLYQKVANGLAVITEASKLTTECSEDCGPTGVESMPAMLPPTKENNPPPPMSTKHSMQPARLMPKETPLSPAGAMQNMQKGGLPSTLSKAKLQVKPQMVAVRPMMKPGAAAAMAVGIKNEVPRTAKVMLPTGDKSGMGEKRTTTPTRKLK